MKKLIFTFLIYILPALLSMPTSISSATSEIYAKISGENCYFFASADNSSPIFILPNTYFVKLVGEEGDYYQAFYRECKGYVKKGEVLPMNGTPSTPYYITKFRMFLPNGSYLYSSPVMSEEGQICQVGYLNDTLSFYGSIEGIGIPDKSNLWHYCKFENGSFGYVYSVFCDQLSSPPENPQTFDIITPNFTPAIAEPTSSMMAFIIIGVSIPFLIVIYLLVKPNLHTETNKEKVIKVRRRRKDYFEFDEGDLT